MYQAEKFYEELKVRVSSLSKHAIAMDCAVCVNDVPIHGLRVDSGISPVVGIDKYYHQEMDDAAIDGIASCVTTMLSQQYDIAQDLVDGDFSKCAPKIYAGVVNTRTNKAYLADLVHFEMLDLSVYFYIALGVDNGAVLNITYDIAQRLKMSGGALCCQALSNMLVKEYFMYESIGEAVKHAMSVSEVKRGTCDMDAAFDDCQLYVATNKLMCRGACVIICAPFLHKISEELGSFYILPSSIHEIICVPYVRDIDVHGLKDIVSMVNATELKPSEILSNSVYFYDHHANCVSIM